MKYKTKREAAEAWVHEFNAIPQAIIEKLMNNDFDEVHEITPPGAGDHVTVFSGEYNCCEGEIVRKDTKHEGCYIVKLEGYKKIVSIPEGEFDVERDGILPMWGTMWAFGDRLDNDWLDGEYCESGLQAMADCGFRVYEQEDYGYVFGIDGCGYDFYEAHWIPLYEARGLHWHEEEASA